MALMRGLYSLTIIATLLRLHPRTLINYEKEGFVKPERTATSRRLFSDEDLKKLLFIKYLRQEKKLGISGIKLILEQNLKHLFPDFNAVKRLKEILK